MQTVTIYKFRWSKVYESSEEELLALFAASSLTASRHDGGAFEAVGDLVAQQTLTLWCAEGSCKLQVAAASYSLQAGDAIRLPATTAYSIAAGIAGYSYYTTVE